MHNTPRRGYFRAVTGLVVVAGIFYLSPVDHRYQASSPTTHGPPDHLGIVSSSAIDLLAPSPSTPTDADVMMASHHALYEWVTHLPPPPPPPPPGPPATALPAVVKVSEPSTPSTTASSSPSPYSSPSTYGHIDPYSLPSPWACIVEHESGGNNVVADNGHYGYFQFSISTWHGVGESGVPTSYPFSVQYAAAKRLQAQSGWSQWSTSWECGA